MSTDKLTPKQAAFVRAYLKTGSPSQAYAQAYDVKRMSAKAIGVEAAKLLNHPGVSLATRVLHEKADAKALLSLEQHMEKLKELRDAAAAEGDFSPAIKAEELRGKLRRFYVEQVEVGGVGEFKEKSDEELDEFIASEAAAISGHITTH